MKKEDFYASILGVIILCICILIAALIYKAKTPKTQVYQIEYNHRVDLDTCNVVSNLNKDTIYCIWYNNKPYILDSISLNNQ